MATPADICRENGWTVGTRLVGDEGRGPEMIEITAIGERKILAKRVLPIEDRESSWALDARVWTVVYPLSPKPFVYIHSHGYSRSAIPDTHEAQHPAMWKWEPLAGYEQRPERYDQETQRNYQRVTEDRKAAARALINGRTRYGSSEARLDGGDVPCPHDGEMVNRTCWMCGWER